MAKARMEGECEIGERAASNEPGSRGGPNLDIAGQLGSEVEAADGDAVG